MDDQPQTDHSSAGEVPPKFELAIEVQGSNGIPSFNGTLQRRNVFLGANGSGKSKLLDHLKGSKKYGLPDTVIYVEGGRVVTPPTSVQINRNNADTYRSLKTARDSYVKQRPGLLKNRTETAFFLLKKMNEGIKSDHSDKVEEWRRKGEIGDCPLRGQDPFVELFELFHIVFPSISLKLMPESEDIRCEKRGATYAPTYLSDGEKQVLCLLADIALLADDGSLIVVDEPELNLHPHLAEDLWNTVELRYPNCVFIYATHSVAFTLRASVEKVFVLNRDDQPTIEIGSIAELNSGELRPFLGAIPAILASDVCLLVEGTQKSFDTALYRWITGVPNLVIEPIGGSSEVANASKGVGVWEKIAPASKILGVIDRDFNTDEKLSELDNEHLLVLKLHEAESYLCDPMIIHKIASGIGSAPKIPTIDEITNKILSHAEESVRYVVAQRAFMRLRFPLNPSLLNSQVRSIGSDADLVEAIKAECLKEGEKIKPLYDAGEVANVVNKELKRCRKVITECDIDGILRIFEGKELLKTLHTLASCPDPESVIRAATKHLNIGDFANIKQLRDDLLTGLHHRETLHKNSSGLP